METKDLNQAAKGAEKKNEDKKNGKAAKIAGMAGGMAAAAGAGVAGTMAAQGMNTPEDEWVEDPENLTDAENNAEGGNDAGEEASAEDEVFDVNDIRIDDEEDGEDTADDDEIVVAENENGSDVSSEEHELAHEPIGSEDDIVSGEFIDIDPVDPEGDDIFVVSNEEEDPTNLEIEEVEYGGPIDFPDDDPEDYLAGADIADDILI